MVPCTLYMYDAPFSFGHIYTEEIFSVFGSFVFLLLPKVNFIYRGSKNLCQDKWFQALFWEFPEVVIRSRHAVSLA